jgi:hypothetical protein
MAKPEQVKSPVIYTPHAQQVCGDCGKLGCLIPVTHAAPEQRTGDETV